MRSGHWCSPLPDRLALIAEWVARQHYPYPDHPKLASWKLRETATAEAVQAASATGTGSPGGSTFRSIHAWPNSFWTSRRLGPFFQWFLFVYPLPLATCHMIINTFYKITFFGRTTFLLFLCVSSYRFLPRVFKGRKKSHKQNDHFWTVNRKKNIWTL